MLVGQLTTHVLDTAHGRPGTGMAVTLYRRAGDRYESIKSVTTNADGRVDAPLLEGDALSAGRFTLDATYLPNGCPIDLNAAGILAQPNDKSQFLLRAQFQLLL